MHFLQRNTFFSRFIFKIFVTYCFTARFFGRGDQLTNKTNTQRIFQGSTQSPLDVAGVILQSPLESAFNAEKKRCHVKGMFFVLNVFARFHFTTTLGNDLIWQHYFFLKRVLKNHFPLTTLRIGSPQRKVVFQQTIFKTQIEKSHNLSELRGRNASTSKTMRFWGKKWGQPLRGCLGFNLRDYTTHLVWWGL